MTEKFKSGQKVLVKKIVSYCTHPYEHRNIQEGDIIEVAYCQYEPPLEIIWVDGLVLTTTSGQVYDEVEIIEEGNSLNSYKCTCDIFSLMNIGCKCGGI